MQSWEDMQVERAKPFIPFTLCISEDGRTITIEGNPKITRGDGSQLLPGKATTYGSGGRVAIISPARGELTPEQEATVRDNTRRAVTLKEQLGVSFEDALQLLVGIRDHSQFQQMLRVETEDGPVLVHVKGGQ